MDFQLLERFKQLANNEMPIKALTQGDNACPHENIVTELASRVCMDCGHELEQELKYDKEWNVYYASDKAASARDTSRCYMRKVCSKNIFKDLENLGFNAKIIHTANELYQHVTQGKIYRGNSRKSIVFAVCFHAFKLNGNAQTSDNLIRIFGLKRKIGLKGLKYIHLNIPKEIQIPNIRITPEHIINDIMQRFIGSEQDQIQKVMDIYNSVKDKSNLLSRSRPTSTAAGIIYYYILQTKKSITLKQFSREVELSELTIKKIVRELTLLLGDPVKTQPK